MGERSHQGKSKKTTDLRKRLGDPAKNSESSPRPAPAFTAPQGGLSPTPPVPLASAGLALWQSAVGTAKWLTASDGPALLFACQLKDRMQEELISDKQPSPATSSLFKTYQIVLNDLGLTPRARITLGLAVVETESKLSAFKRDS